MTAFFHTRKKRALAVFLLIVAGSLLARLLNHYHFHESALLYVGLPMLISFVLILLLPKGDENAQSINVSTFMAYGFIVFFGSSILLFEGFICVLFTLPIYAMVLGVIYAIANGARRANAKRRNRLGVQLLPVLLLASAFEGTSPELSFDRQERVSATQVLPLSVDEIKARLLQPMDTHVQRPWLLRVFPMPHREVKPSLEAGAIHELHFRYYRWFVANLHEGSIRMKVLESAASIIRTRVLEDTSYLANYLRLEGMTLTFESLTANCTRVSLSIDYERKLDPYWYFGPLERYGVGQMASHLLVEVLQ